MEIDAAKAKLGVEDHSDPEAVQAAYIERVREAHGNPDFEGVLLELNLAREVLLADSAGGRAIVPVLGSELVAIAARQNELIKINEARDEIKDTLGSIERRSVRQIKSGRDIAGLFSAASGGLLFAKDNITELIPSLVASNVLSQTLLLFSVMFGLFAFMAHHKSSEVTSQMDEISRALTRDRQISRLLLQVFRSEESLGEVEFEKRLAEAIFKTTGAGHVYSSARRTPGVYGVLGFLVPMRIYFGHDFIDDYIDYLTKSGYIKSVGVSGEDMVFYKIH